jgi:phosphatidylglycerophosphate synthase
VSAVELSGGPPKPGLVNVANALTVLRLIRVPVFVVCLLACGTRGRLAALVVFVVAMAAAVVVTLVTGADYVARAVRLYRSPAPPGS